MKKKSVLKLVSLFLIPKKLYFSKCAHFLLFLSLSTVLTHQFHSYTKILTLIPSLSSPVPHISTPIPNIPTPIPRIPSLIPHIPTLIPRIAIIPLIPFPNSPFWLLQIALKILKNGPCNW